LIIQEKMIKNKLVNINPRMPNTQREIDNDFQGDFLKYLEHILDNYVNEGWVLISSNVYANPYGSEFRELFIFQKDDTL